MGSCKRVNTQQEPSYSLSCPRKRVYSCIPYEMASYFFPFCSQRQKYLPVVWTMHQILPNSLWGGSFSYIGIFSEFKLMIQSNSVLQIGRIIECRVF